jgi:hypothetical protein
MGTKKGARSRRYPGGPPQPDGDFPRQPRPPGGFTRPFTTCTCGYRAPTFYFRVFERCLVCFAPWQAPITTAPQRWSSPRRRGHRKAAA